MNKILVTPTRPFETVNEPAQDAFLVVSGMALVFMVSPNTKSILCR